MAGPELVVRVSANLTELKKALSEGVTQFETTRSSLNQMSNAFDGSRIISQAGAVVGALLQIGDVTKLTAAEQARANAILTEALDKYKALGREAPPGMSSLAAATKANVQPTNDLHKAFSAFDGVLATLGIHIGPEVKGLEDLAGVSGKTASQLGLIAVAGLAVGAATGGWKIGRAIADFFDLDHMIGNATARLLGWGDVAAEVAGNKADQLARASARVGFEVVSLTTALEINSSAQKDWHSNADISAAVVAKWHSEIAKVKSGGELDSLSADLKSQNFTLQDLARRYEISVDAIQLFVRETKAADEADKVANDNIQARNRFKLQHLQEEITANKAARDKEAASLEQVTRLTDEYTEALAGGGSELNKQVAAIDRWAQDLMAKAQRAGTDTKEFYEALTALWNQKLKEASQATQKSVTETCAVMVSSLTKANEAVMGIAAGLGNWNRAIMGASSTLRGMSMATAALSGDLDSNVKSVRTLGGAWITAADAKKAFDSGGSFSLATLTDADLKRLYGSVDAAKARLEEIKNYYITNPGAAAGADGPTGISQTDEAGWRRLLLMQQEYAQLQAALAKTTASTADAITTATKKGADAVTAIAAAAGAKVVANLAANAAAVAWASERFDEETQRTLLADANSKASFTQRAKDAFDTYQFMIKHSDQYTATDIANAKKRADAANNELANWRAYAELAIEGVTDAAARESSLMIASLNAQWAVQAAEQLAGLTFGGLDQAPRPRIGYAGGVTNAPGGWAMVGEKGPEPMYVPPGANIYPTGTAPGGLTMAAGAVQIALHYPIMRDARAQAEIVNIVSDGLIKKLVGMGWRPPAGA